MPYTILDRALGLASDFHDSRREARNSILRRIIPEDYQPEDLKISQVPQPEELKEAEAKPMKEEGPKTLHAPKYDRRMKFNTALERSKHEASKEEPAWLKGAASPEELQRHQAVNRIMLEFLNNPNASSKKRDGTSVMDLQQLPEETQSQVQKAFKWLRFAPKQASDFDSIGITGRETTVSTEDILPTTPPLPIEEPSWYDMPNRPVMQKSSSELAKLAVSSIRASKGAESLAPGQGIFELEEPTFGQKAMPIAGGVGMGILPLTGYAFSNNPSLGALGAAGLMGAGVGLGTYGLLRRAQTKSREEAQKTIDVLNAVHRPRMEDFARTTIEKEGKTADTLFEDDTFTQRHPGVLPSAIGLGGAALLGIPAALLGGRRAVKMVQKANTRNIADVQARFDAAKAAVLNARKAKANVGDTRRLWDDLKKLDVDLSAAKAHVPDTASAQSAGRAIGGAYGGLLGGGTGVLGGLALNNPQQYEY